MENVAMWIGIATGILAGNIDARALLSTLLRRVEIVRADGHYMTIVRLTADDIVWPFNNTKKTGRDSRDIWRRVVYNIIGVLAREHMRLAEFDMTPTAWFFNSDLSGLNIRNTDFWKIVDRVLSSKKTARAGVSITVRPDGLTVSLAWDANTPVYVAQWLTMRHVFYAVLVEKVRNSAEFFADMDKFRAFQGESTRGNVHSHNGVFDGWFTSIYSEYCKRETLVTLKNGRSKIVVSDPNVLRRDLCVTAWDGKKRWRAIPPGMTGDQYQTLVGAFKGALAIDYSEKIWTYYMKCLGDYEPPPGFRRALVVRARQKALSD
jgi:hypothetical protein